MEATSTVLNIFYRNDLIEIYSYMFSSKFFQHKLR